MNLLERIIDINQNLTEKKSPEKLKYKYKGKNVSSTIFTAKGRWMAKNKIMTPAGGVEKAWDTEAGDKESLRKFIKNDIEAILAGKEPRGGKKAQKRNPELARIGVDEPTVASITNPVGKKELGIIVKKADAIAGRENMPVDQSGSMTLAFAHLIASLHRDAQVVAMQYNPTISELILITIGGPEGYKTYNIKLDRHLLKENGYAFMDHMSKFWTENRHGNLRKTLLGGSIALYTLVD